MPLSPLFLTVYLIVTALIVPSQSTLAATNLVVIHAGPCANQTGLVVSINELTITFKNYDSVFSGSVNVTEDIENGWKVVATMQKCQDIRNTETCDFFKTFHVVRSGCSEERREDEEELYQMVFHYLEPELECPIRAGTYRLKEFPVFSEDNFITVTEAKISTSIFGYTYTIDGYSQDGNKIFCAEAHLQLLYMRDHNWLAKHHTQGPKTNEKR